MSSTPFDAPQDLKPMFPYLQRALEVEDRDPAVAYWCKMYVAQQAIVLTKSMPGVRSWLMSFVDVLEQEKLRLKDTYEAVSDMMVAHAHVESFALACFSSADSEDCACQATLRTAKVYLAASHYIDVVIGNFMPSEGDSGNQRPDAEALREKAKYAKWRATEILKAQKLGIKVAPPPHVAQKNDDAAHTAGATAAAAAAAASQQQQPQQQQLYQPPIQAIPGVIPSYMQQPQQPAAAEAAPAIVPQVHATRAAPLPAAISLGARAALAIDARIAAAVTKNAKFAISALEHDDVPTAITNLRTALESLEKAYYEQK